MELNLEKAGECPYFCSAFEACREQLMHCATSALQTPYTYFIRSNLWCLHAVCWIEYMLLGAYWTQARGQVCLVLSQSPE